jgi:hypothetical protein
MRCGAAGCSGGIVRPILGPHPFALRAPEPAYGCPNLLLANSSNPGGFVHHRIWRCYESAANVSHEARYPAFREFIRELADKAPAPALITHRKRLRDLFLRGDSLNILMGIKMHSAGKSVHSSGNRAFVALTPLFGETGCTPKRGARERPVFSENGSALLAAFHLTPELSGGVAVRLE